MSAAGAVKIATQGAALALGMLIEGANATEETRKVEEQVARLRETLADAERAARDARRELAMSSSDTMRGLEEAMAHARGYLKKYDEAGIYVRSRNREVMATSLMYLQELLNMRMRKLEMEATNRPRRGILKKSASAGATLGAPPPLVRRMPPSPVRHRTPGRELSTRDPVGHSLHTLRVRQWRAEMQPRAFTPTLPMSSPSPGLLQHPASPGVYTPAPSLYSPTPAVHPTGQPMYPMGRPMYFPGQNSQTVYPEEQAFYPSGQILYSNGSPVYPDGQVLYPDPPQTVQHGRETPYPSPRTRFPDGQASVSGRPRFFTDGHNVHPSHGGYYLS